VCTSGQSTAFDLLDTLRNDEPSDGFVDLVSLLGDHPVSSPESYVSNSSPEREDEDDSLIETKMFFKNEESFFDETIINPKTQPTVYPTKVKQEPLRTNFTFGQNQQQSLNTFVSQYVQSQKNQKTLPIPNFMNASNPFMSMPTMQMFGTPNFLLNQPIITPTPPIPTVQTTCVKEESDARKKLKRRRQTNEINTNIDDPEKQKELKRQKRLIKNRESAQASRERKKRYLQGLEEKVEELSNNNITLNNKVRSLEEENRYLREQLQRAMKGEKIEEPVLKKRKVEDTTTVQQNAKLPLPPVNSQTNNGIYSFTQFFNPMNWAGLVPNLGQPGMPWQGSQVVLFVMLICVGLFVFQTGIDVDKGTKYPFEDKKMQSDVVNKRVGFRKILNAQCPSNVETVPHENTKNDVSKEIEMLYSHMERIVKLISDKDNEEVKTLDQFVGKVSLKWDEKHENLIFSLPLGKNFDDSKIKNETELYKLFSVSKNTLSDICAKLSEV